MKSQTNQTIIALESQWLSVIEKQSEFQSSLEQSLQTMHNQSQETINTQTSLLEKLTIIKQKIHTRIYLINQSHHKLQTSLSNLKHHRKILPLRQPINHQKLKNLSVQIANLLKYNKLSIKKQIIHDQHNRHLHQIKQSIKRVKLKTSLIELQFRQVLPPKKQTKKHPPHN